MKNGYWAVAYRTILDELVLKGLWDIGRDGEHSKSVLSPQKLSGWISTTTLSNVGNFQPATPKSLSFPRKNYANMCISIDRH
jgi:hypothetical protein